MRDYYARSVEAPRGRINNGEGNPVSRLSGSAERQVFISYSHKDADQLTELLKHLSPFFGGTDIVWSDKQIMPGHNWRETLDGSLQTCAIAVLVVSSEFLNSEYIRTKELPELIERGIPLIWFPIDVCNWTAVDAIEARQCVLKDPMRPLSKWRKDDEENDFWVAVTQAIKLAYDDAVAAARRTLKSADAATANTVHPPKITEFHRMIARYTTDYERPIETGNTEPTDMRFYIALKNSISNTTDDHLLASVMTRFVHECVKLGEIPKDYFDNAVFAASKDAHPTLAHQVAQAFERPLILIDSSGVRSRPKREPLDGLYNGQSVILRDAKVIYLQDVIVSGVSTIANIQHIEQNEIASLTVEHVVALVERTENHAREYLRDEEGITLHSKLKLGDHKLQEIMKGL